MSDPAPRPSVPDSVDAQDLAPALDAAGVAHDLDSPAVPTDPGATGAPAGSEPPEPDPAETGPADPGQDQAHRGLPIDAVLGVIRLGVGVALVAAPRWAGRVWIGPGADGPGSAVFARALGARDVALGLRILDGVRKGEPVRQWVVAGCAADVADAAATLISGRHLTPKRRIAMPLVAGAAGALGIVSSRRAAA